MDLCLYPGNLAASLSLSFTDRVVYQDVSLSQWTMYISERRFPAFPSKKLQSTNQFVAVNQKPFTPFLIFPDEPSLFFFIFLVVAPPLRAKSEFKFERSLSLASNLYVAPAWKRFYNEQEEVHELSLVPPRLSRIIGRL